MKKLAMLTISILVLSLTPTLAGAGHDDHAMTDADRAGASCAAAIQNVTRTVTPIDGGVRIEFRSRDRKALDRIARLAAEGRIFGPGPDGKLLERRMRRGSRSVTITAMADTTAQLEHVRTMAKRFDGPTPMCGERIARQGPSPRQG